jgi:hypothetical protein
MSKRLFAGPVIAIIGGLAIGGASQAQDKKQSIMWFTRGTIYWTFARAATIYSVLDIS